jgi:hypothetical protein
MAKPFWHSSPEPSRHDGVVDGLVVLRLLACVFLGPALLRHFPGHDYTIIRAALKFADAMMAADFPGG